MNKILKLALIGVTFVTFSGFSKGNAETYVLKELKKIPSQIDELKVTPKLVKLVKSDKTVYLFGTIHIGKDNFYPLPDYVMNSFKASKSLAVEMDMTDPKILAEVGQLFALSSIFTDGKKLSDYLNKAEIDKLIQYIPNEMKPQINIFKPWIIQVSVGLGLAKKAGYSEKKGIDIYLINKAKSMGKEVISLEVASEQIEAMSSGTNKDTAELIHKQLSDIDENGVNDVLKMIEFWKKGSDDIAAKFIQEQEMLFGKETIEKFNQAMLYGRNKNMATRISKSNENNNPLFVAVGAMHIYGKKTVQSYLKEQGYKVAK